MTDDGGIVNEFEALRGKVVELIDESERVLGDELPDSEREVLERLRARVASGQYFVLVCGEFKRGKSTLINALLGEPDLCPTDIDIATNLVTTISFAPEEQITVHVGEIGHTKPVSITRDQIADYVTEAGNPKNAKQARVMEVGLVNAALASGLVLVDTPGVGGLNVEHTAVTYSFLPNADATLFVCDAVEPLSVRELEFLDDVIAYCDTVVVAVTKIDLATDPDTVVEATRERVAERLGRAANDLIVVPVSSTRKLDGDADGDAELIELSNVPALERELWDGIGREAGSLQMGAALGRLEASIERVRAPLAVESAAIKDEGREKLGELKAQIDDLEARNAAFQKQGASWRDKLLEGIGRAGRTTLHALGDEFDLIERKIEVEYLADETLVAAPEELVNAVVRDITLAINTSASLFEDAVTELVDDLAAETSLELHSFPGVAPPAFEGNTNLAAIVVEQRAAASTDGRKLLHTARGWSNNGKPGALIGGIIGGVLTLPFGGSLWGAGAGAAIGKLIGGWVGMREQVDIMKETERRDRAKAVGKALMPMLKSNKREASAAVDDMVQDARKALLASLAESIELEGKAIAELRRSVNEAGKLTVAEAKARLAVLDQRVGELDGLGQRVFGLRATLTERQVAEHLDEVAEALDDLETEVPAKDGPS